MLKSTFIVDELLNRLKSLSKQGYGKENVYISVPFRDGLGIQYEGIVNVTHHSGIADIFITVPDHDNKL